MRRITVLATLLGFVHLTTLDARTECSRTASAAGMIIA